MFALVGVGIYLILGYFWVRIFTTWVLEDKKWADKDDFGPGSAVIVNIAWLPMAVIMLMFLTVWAVCMTFNSASIRRFYNLNPKA